MTAGAWAGRRVLVTGHTGFKGAWLTLWLEHLGADVTGLALPADDPAGAFAALAPWPGLTSMIVDIREPAAVQRAVAAAAPDVIIHLAAQAIVRQGYADPTGTWAVNVLGTANVLEAARTVPSLRAVVVVTSDKVYANPPAAEPFVEADRLGGSDPYSSSKAAAELATRSWQRSFFDGGPVGIATARAGNVIGGGDRGRERLFPDVWRALEAGQPVPLRYPHATRPWQFVLEPLFGYLLLAARLAEDPEAAPEAVNFGPDPSECLPVVDVVERLLALCGGGTWEPVREEQPSEATTLRLDATLAGTALGWRPRLDLDTAMAWTVAWWRAAGEGDLRKLALSQIEAYEELLR